MKGDTRRLPLVVGSWVFGVLALVSAVAAFAAFVASGSILQSGPSRVSGSPSSFIAPLPLIALAAMLGAIAGWFDARAGGNSDRWSERASKLGAALIVAPAVAAGAFIFVVIPVLIGAVILLVVLEATHVTNIGLLNEGSTEMPNQTP